MGDPREHVNQSKMPNREWKILAVHPLHPSWPNKMRVKGTHIGPMVTIDPLIGLLLLHISQFYSCLLWVTLQVTTGNWFKVFLYGREWCITNWATSWCANHRPSIWPIKLKLWGPNVRTAMALWTDFCRKRKIYFSAMLHFSILGKVKKIRIRVLLFKENAKIIIFIFVI